MKQSWLCYLVLSIISVYAEYNTINLDHGKIQGHYNCLDGYWSYLGIPYAEFKGRYQVPGDPPSWNGTLIANRSTISCIQYSPSTMTIMGEEDCLTLNIYTPISPSNKSAALLSVMFYIHGGGFHSGSDSEYNPKYLVKKEVVIVVANYRVGAFGFLCLRNNGAAGNMGLKDQLAALKWTKKNIACFGGDPESITIFGESVGGSSVDYIILTQTAKGLFHRAIMESGTSLTYQAFDKNPISTASEAATRLGYNTSDTDELLKIFLNSTANDVAKISNRDRTNNPLAQYIFKPCKENPNTSDKPILTTDPQKLVKAVKDICNISIIIGYNNKEGIFWASNYDMNGLQMLNKNFSSAVPNGITYKKPEYKADLINDIREYYFDNASTNYSALINYFSDVIIMNPSVSTMKAYLSNPDIAIYVYYFSYSSMRNLGKMRTTLSKVQGASHVDELLYLFDSKILNSTPIPKDMEMIDRMTSFWTNFAKTGVPSANVDIAWPRSENTLKFLNLDEELKVVDLPNKDRIDFWKRAYENYTITC